MQGDGGGIALATARLRRQEQAENGRAKATTAEELKARAAEQAKAAKEKAIEAAETAGVEPPDLEPWAADGMPRRGLARKADGTPKAKTQCDFIDPNMTAV